MMENLGTVLSEITRLTYTIESDYPELYRFLDETPMTIPSDANPTIDLRTLKDYLESLQQMLKHYLETHSSS